jgi:aspartate racemase
MIIRVYHDPALINNLNIIVPDEENQNNVMESIYREYGIIAGFFKGKCLEDITKAINHLGEQGAEVAIQRCMELPIMFPESSDLMLANGEKISLIDPTTVLAKTCVNITLER